LKEYADACEANDLVEILDSLADQLYILLGTAVKHGLQYKLGEAFDLVHHNNMTKLDANGEPILRADGKILKPEGFVPVKLNHLLEEEVKNG
jgi:predicted HAD superfamily Cof-like phosphohydrolase